MAVARSIAAASPMRTIPPANLPGLQRVGTGPPAEIKQRLQTTLREPLVEVGARIVWCAQSITFQMARAMVARGLFQELLVAIATRDSRRRRDAEHTL